MLRHLRHHPGRVLRLRGLIGPAGLASVCLLALASGASHAAAHGGSDPDYQWVNPPPGDLENERPEPLLLPLRFGPGGSEALNVTTPDGQCALYLPEGAVPGSGRRALLSVVPADPATLAPLPAGLAANSNAYQVELRGVEGAARGRWTMPGPMVLVGAGTSEGIYELDGRRWVKRDVGPDESVAAGRFRIGGEGTFVLLTPRAPVDPASGRWAAPAAVVALVAILAVIAIMRRRSARISGRAPSG